MIGIHLIKFPDSCPQCLYRKTGLSYAVHGGETLLTPTSEPVAGYKVKDFIHPTQEIDKKYKNEYAKKVTRNHFGLLPIHGFFKLERLKETLW